MSEIITDVVGMMGNVLDGTQLNRLRLVLAQVLSNYDITEKPREIATCEDVNSGYVMKFLAWKTTEGKSDNTIRLYGYVINKMLAAVNKPVPQITEDDIFLYMAVAKRDGASNRYLNNIRLVLSSFFGWLYSKGMITKNPISGISSIKVEKVIKKPFSDEELEKMRRSLQDVKEIAIIEFMYATGVRVSELCSINLSDVDFSGKFVKVFGKGSKERIVPISISAIWHLRQYLQERGYEEGALFLNRRNKRYKPAGIEALLVRVGEKSDIENVHPHRFRRTLATNLLKKGMQIEEVSKILGHSKLDTTMIYCNIDSEVVRNNYSRIMTA